MKKKLIAVLLALALALSFSISAFAAERPNTDLKFTFPGITVTVTTDKLSDSVYAWNNLNVLGIGKYVYYPADMLKNNKTYPVITWANGSWCPVQTYYGIIEEIVDAGYIVIADTDLLTDDGVSTRDSVDFAYEINADQDGLFYDRLDLDKIGSTGHSLGGQAAVNASSVDSRIKAIVSIMGKSTADEAAKVTVPALYLSSQLDEVVPASKYVKPSYKASAGPAAYASCKLCEHCSAWYYPDQYARYTIQWFNAFLLDDDDARSVFKDGGALSQDSEFTDFNWKGLD